MIEENSKEGLYVQDDEQDDNFDLVYVGFDEKK